jgi:hypothetical protein
MIPVWANNTGGAAASGVFPWQFPEVQEFYDTRYGITSASERVSAWAPTLKGSHSLDQATGANQPILLPYSGTNYCWFPAVAGNTITTPTKTITGNFSILLDVAFDDYTPAGNVAFFDKSSGNNGFGLTLLTTGKLRLSVGNGTNFSSDDTSVASGLTDGSRHTIGINWTDGVGASFTIDGVPWGTAVADVRTLTNGAASLTIGSSSSAMKIYSYSVTDGASTTYYGKTLSTVAEGATGYTDDTGATVTINSTGAKPAQIVGSQQILFDGVAHCLKASAFATNQPLSVLLAVKQITWTNQDYLVDGNTTNEILIYQNSASPNLNIYAGNTVAANTGLVVGSYGVVAARINGASSSLQVNLNAPSTGDAGANNLAGLTLGASGGAVNFANIAVKSAALLNSSPSNARMNQLITAMARQSGISV